MAYTYGDYISVAEQRKKAEREIKKLKRIGFQPYPVLAFKGKIASSFWGARWCENLEEFEDMDYRAERGRRYVRAGCVCHLAMEPGRITAFVSGTELYFVEIGIAPMYKDRWQELCRKCSWEISSIADLYKGEMSARAIALLTDPDNGILPSVDDVTFACSCPDWSDMCKHSAAVLYGVGRMLDERPELLFKLRDVDPYDIVNFNIKIPDNLATIPNADLKAIFDIDLDLPLSQVQNPVQAVFPAEEQMLKLPEVAAKVNRGQKTKINEISTPYAIKQPDRSEHPKAAPADAISPESPSPNKSESANKTAETKAPESATPASNTATVKSTVSKTATAQKPGAGKVAPTRQGKAAPASAKNARPAAKAPKPVLKIFNPKHPTGKSIRALRIHAMLSLEGMARELGVSVGTISRWEGAPMPALKADSIQRLEDFQSRYIAEMAQ